MGILKSQKSTSARFLKAQQSKLQTPNQRFECEHEHKPTAISNWLKSPLLFTKQMTSFQS